MCSGCKGYPSLFQIAFKTAYKDTCYAVKSHKLTAGEQDVINKKNTSGDINWRPKLGE